MKIDDFCAKFAGDSRPIEHVLREWQIIELAGLIHTLRRNHDELIGSAVIAGDAVYGDGMLDQIPGPLRDAFANLMHDKADSYEKIRELLITHLADGNGGYLSLDDSHVLGFISKIKGQIGENLFKHHVGAAAELASSGSQEGWDIAVTQSDGLHEYVQVKLYSNPHGVVRHMLKVQQKLLDGHLLGVNDEVVDQIYFAVPADIHEEVQRLADMHGLSSMLYDQTIPIDSHCAAGIVSEGLSNVGPEQLQHFFDELLFGALTAGSLHAVVNGFLWYKGSKEFSAAVASTVASSAISATGIGLGLLAETVYHTAMFSSAVGIGGRLLLGRMARSRWNFAEFLEGSIAETDLRLRVLQVQFVPQPAVG